MNIYYSFNDFMNQVIQKADDIARQNHNRGLEYLFAVSHDTLDTVTVLIGIGWYAFLAVVGLLLLGWLGFLAALATFMTTPVGIAISAILGIGAFAKIKKMYDEKVLPLAIREVGEKYKSRWEAEHPNPVKVDSLLNQAANELYQKAYRQAMALANN